MRTYKRDMTDNIRQAANILWRAGCRDVPRGLELARRAIAEGDPVEQVCDQVIRNRKEIFGRKQYGDYPGIV